MFGKQNVKKVHVRKQYVNRGKSCSWLLILFFIVFITSLL